MGIPFSFCKLISHIYSSNKCYIRSGKSLATPFTTTTGVAQGCSLSSIIFCLFLSDLPDHLMKLGPKLNESLINYCQYADDLVLIARSSGELAKQLKRFETYCIINDLIVNVEKTEILIFHKGRLPNEDINFQFYINDLVVKRVKKFKYLGFVFTQQLQFSEHLSYVTKKANAKLGYLKSKLSGMNLLTLKTAIGIFNCYVTPTFSYGINIWFNSCSKNSMESMNSVYTKFLKSYLNVPKAANNALVHYVTTSMPLEMSLRSIYTASKNRIYEIMRNLVTNYHFNTLNDNSGNNLNRMEEWTREVCIPMIPTHFWRAKMYKYLPISAVGRRKLMYELFDIRHMQFCCIETYHSIFTEHLSELCICIQCDKPLEHYQLYFGCNPYTEKPEFDVFK